jgi:choline dehydrogenase-like flavoprotein
MAAPYDFNDDSVVVIIGSGAGGGTLGNALAQKGVDVVILEAGARIEREEFINDEWDSFAQLAWLNNRTSMRTWPACGSSVRICRRSRTESPCMGS